MDWIGVSDSRQLSTQDAFVVMREFLWAYAQRAGDDLLTLVGDVGPLADGGPADPAAWSDWLECVDRVQAGGPFYAP